MKVKSKDEARVIISGNDNLFGYYAWPTVARLKNGRIAVTASGMRIAHVCPFGKAMMSVSEDEGKTFSLPTPIIDTVLDDRDSGLCPFGTSGLILTSFNNSVAFQRDTAKIQQSDHLNPIQSYIKAHLDLVSAEDEKRDLGSTFRISHDNGVTFGPVFKSPVTSPHGPIELSDGTVLWTGRAFDVPAFSDADKIMTYTVDTETGIMQYRGEIEKITIDQNPIVSCEPHTVELKNGRLVCHIRAEGYANGRVFTTYQSVSDDKGYTWSKPVPLLSRCGGAPAHLLVHSCGTLICSFGYREANPCYGIRVMFSDDNGENWYGETQIYNNPFTGDLGYPATVELSDGSLMTVFYAHPSANSPAKILAQNWQLSDE